MISPVRAIALVLFLLGTFLHAHSTLLDQQYQELPGTSIRLTALTSQAPDYGELALRVELENSHSKALSWQLSSISHRQNHSFRRRDGHRSTHTLTCPPGESRQFELSLPVQPRYQHSGSYGTSAVLLELEISPSHPDLPEGRANLYTERPLNHPAVLLSEALYHPYKIELDNEIAKRSSSSDFAASFKPEHAPTRWQNYLGYQLIMMPSEDWRALSPPARQAILRSVRLGNHLHLVPAKAEDTWQTLALPEHATPQQSYGLGKLHLTPIPNARALANLARDFSLDNTPLHTLSSSLLDHKHPLVAGLGRKVFRYGPLLALLIVFALCAGPLNLFYLAPKNYRHRLLWTTPLIALVTCLLLALLILLQDGIGGKGQRSALIILPGNEENAAYQLQTQLSRSGLLLSDAFPLADETLALPALTRNSRWATLSPSHFDGSHPFSYQGGKEEQKLSGQWFQSRREQAQVLITRASQRGRLTLVASGDSPALRSTLSHPLGEVRFRDEQGRFWRASQLDNQAPVSLEQSSEEDWIAFLNECVAQLDPALSSPLHQAAARPGTLLALAPDAPFTPSHGSIDWQDQPAVFLATPAQP